MSRDEDYQLLHAAGAYDKPTFDPDAAALVVIDMINWQIPDEPIPDTLATPYYVDRVHQVVIPATQRLLAVARSCGMAVAFLRVGCYRNDCQDAIPPFQETFRVANAREGQGTLEVVSELAPEPGELTLVKTGSSGYLTSSLHQQLQNMGIKHVVYTGVLTNACVMLTASAGFDLGYNGYVVTDATATVSQAVQDDTETVIGTFMAQLVTADEAVRKITEASVVPAGTG